MKEKVKKVVLPICVCAGTALASFPAFAEGAAVDANALVTQAATSIQADMMSSIAAITPIALGVVGAVIAIKFGLKFFQNLTGTRK